MLYRHFAIVFQLCFRKIQENQQGL